MHTHRHFIVAPLCVLILALSVLPGVRDGLVSWKDGPGKHEPLPEEWYGGDGIVEIEMDGDTLMSLGGVFFASRNGRTLSVAAVSSPVLVRSGSSAVLVPVSMQWRAGADLRPVPLAFLWEHLAKIRDNDFEKFTADLLSDTVTLLGAFLEEKDHWLLASVHPDLRDRVWTFAVPDTLSRRELGLALTAFPQSDILPLAASPFIVDKWRQAVLTFIAREENPGTFLSLFARAVHSAIGIQMERGYPARVERYREVLEEIVEEYEEFDEMVEMVLSDSRSKSEIRLVSAKARAEVRNPKSETDPNIQNLKPDTSETFDAGMVEAIAYGMLRDAGAAHTIHTGIVAVSPTSVQVEGIIFSGQPYAFMLDIESGEVRDIEQDGKALPLPLPLEQFVDWANSI